MSSIFDMHVVDGQNLWSRRGFIALAALATTSLFVGCSAPAQDSQSASSNSGNDDSSSTASSASTNATPANESGEKTLVVYYSATGNTRKVAEEAAQALDAEVFELTPVHPYTEADLDWTDDDSRVSLEHNDPSLRNVELVSVTPPDFESYGRILLGYPIWWGGAAWPVDEFVEDNDFSGKTIIPFCTSSSSGVGESATDLASLAGTGTWVEGTRFASSASPDTVREWALGLQ